MLFSSLGVHGGINKHRFCKHHRWFVVTVKSFPELQQRSSWFMITMFIIWGAGMSSLYNILYYVIYLHHFMTSWLLFSYFACTCGGFVLMTTQEEKNIKIHPLCASEWGFCLWIKLLESFQVQHVVLLFLPFLFFCPEASTHFRLTGNTATWDTTDDIFDFINRIMFRLTADLRSDSRRSLQVFIWQLFTL